MNVKETMTDVQDIKEKLVEQSKNGGDDIESMQGKVNRMKDCSRQVKEIDEKVAVMKEKVKEVEDDMKDC